MKAVTSGSPISLRVAPPVKPDEASNPGHVCLLGAQAVVPKADLFSKAIEESWRLGHSLDSEQRI